MSQSRSGGTQNRQSANESEHEAANRRASADAKSRVKDHTGKGASGGARQKQKR